MTMRIAIDYTPAIRQGAGIGRYTRGLVRALMELDAENEYVLLVVGKGQGARGKKQEARSKKQEARSKRQEGNTKHETRNRKPGIAPASCILHLASLPPNFRLRHIPLPHRLLTILWHRLRLPLPAEVFTGAADLFHSPDFVLPPLRRARGLITVHDLAFLRVPECADPGLRAYLSQAVPRSLARAHRILADSQNTKRDLMELLDVPAERIRVVPAGVDPCFRPVDDEAELERVRSRYSLREPFVLSLGMLEPRKNFTRLIEAHALLRRRLPSAPGLVIAGGKGWLYEGIFAAAEKSGGGRVRFLGFVPDEALPALYTLAELFVYPSLYEGFGLPPLEAMACGTPVVCSDRPSLPETAGDAALMVDAEDVEGLAVAMRRVLEDEALRARLVEKGFAQARRFTWEKAAQKLLAVYQEAKP
ncbi:MAG: glycosyltransferase family 1 protein [Anaerolineae bacterium]|nr:glycosyltransferase family 1 protein [Anaerolineae bacterium]